MRKTCLAPYGLVLVAGGSLCAADPGSDLPSAASLLSAAVDAPTAKARAAAAATLAARGDVTMEAWIAAASAFAPAGQATAGATTETVPLQVLEAVEVTEMAVYVPETYAPAKAAPLLLAFHGTGGRGAEVLPPWKETAEALGMIVVAPTEAGANDGYHFSARERAATLATVRWARRRFHVDEDRIFASGISRGGHLVWDVAARFPDVFAALAPMIGAPRVTTVNGVNNLRYLENLVDVPIRDLQGSKDDEHLVANLRLAFERLAAWKAKDARLLEFPERGHDFDFDAVDWKAFLGSARRDPAAARVLRRSSSAAEGRAAWVEILAVDPATVTEDVRPNQPGGWNQMDDDAKRRFVTIEADKRTARLEVRRLGPGRFEARSAGVRRFRLLLRAEDLDGSQPVVVTWNGQPLTRTVTRSKAVLLREFVERFERGYLPVAEIVVGS